MVNILGAPGNTRNGKNRFGLMSSRLRRLLAENCPPPRRPGRSVHQDNTPGEGSTYFKFAVGIPVLDEVLSDLKQRFGKDQLTISKLLTLSPAILISKTPEEVQEDLKEGLNHFSKVDFIEIVSADYLSHESKFSVLS